MVAGGADGKRDDSDCSTRGVSAGAILVKIPRTCVYN